MNDNNELKGLGGWLGLVGLGLIISPIRQAIFMYTTYYPMFEEGVFSVLTSVDSEAYHPFWKYYIGGEITFNSLMVLATFVLLYLFFSKHYLFPKFFIFILLINIGFIPLDASLIKVVMPEEEIFDPDTLNTLIRSLICGVVWVPYMLFSKRVKATFTEKKPSIKYG